MIGDAIEFENPENHELIDAFFQPIYNDANRKSRIRMFASFKKNLSQFVCHEFQFKVWKSILLKNEILENLFEKTKRMKIFSKKPKTMNLVRKTNILMLIMLENQNTFMENAIR